MISLKMILPTSWSGNLVKIGKSSWRGVERAQKRWAIWGEARSGSMMMGSQKSRELKMLGADSVIVGRREMRKFSTFFFRSDE